MIERTSIERFAPGRGRHQRGLQPAPDPALTAGTAVDQVADLLRRILPYLLRIGLFTLIALVVVELVIALGAASLRLLQNPGALILIGLLWLWKRRGKGLF